MATLTNFEADGDTLVSTGVLVVSVSLGTLPKGLAGVVKAGHVDGKHSSNLSVSESKNLKSDSAAVGIVNVASTAELEVKTSSEDATSGVATPGYCET